MEYSTHKYCWYSAVKASYKGSYSSGRCKFRGASSSTAVTKFVEDKQSRPGCQTASGMMLYVFCHSSVWPCLTRDPVFRQEHPGGV